MSRLQRKALILSLALVMPASTALDDGPQSFPVQCLDYEQLRDSLEGDHGQVIALSGRGSAGSLRGRPLWLRITYHPGRRDYAIYLIDPANDVACLLSAGQLDDRGS